MAVAFTLRRYLTPAVDGRDACLVASWIEPDLVRLCNGVKLGRLGDLEESPASLLERKQTDCRPSSRSKQKVVSILRRLLEIRQGR